MLLKMTTTCGGAGDDSAAGGFTADNHPVLHTPFSSRIRRTGQAALGLALAFAFAATACVSAQTDGNAGGPAAGGPAAGRILLVLPFENRSGQPSLEWVREAAPEILSSRFTSAGFQPMSRTDRMYALDHLGLPEGFHPSRASSLKLAETLDADQIVVGSFLTDGTSIVAEASLVDVPHLRMSPAVTARGEMRDLVAVFSSLAWKLTRQLDPSSKVSEETFVAAGAGLRVDAFEQYTRGITESDQQERLRHLNQAVLLNPQFGPAWMALGREQYRAQQYEQAAAAFAKVGESDPNALEAGFYRGISLLFFGDYGRAEESFAGVARILPLAEVLNNQGVAQARRGKDGTALFRQAVAADPSDADYHFNLAVSLKRHNEAGEALTELAQELKLHPADAEAQELEKAWNGAGKVMAALPEAGTTEALAAKPDPLERIVRNFDAAAFHQAAQMLDQMEAQRLAALGPRERAQKLSAQGRDFLDHGLLMEAERSYLTAVSDDERSAAAHAGLAEVRERTGDAAAARKEATASLELLPSAEAYTVLGRLNLAGGRRDEARQNAASALAIDPKSKAALELKRKIEGGDGQSK
jgi:tetratricopeptide (TPR) repeat protein